MQSFHVLLLTQKVAEMIVHFCHYHDYHDYISERRKVHVATSPITSKLKIWSKSTII